MRSLLWMAVTADEYELPICVAETAGMLARKLGTSVVNVYSYEAKKSSGKKIGYRIVKIENINQD